MVRLFNIIKGGKAFAVLKLSERQETFPIDVMDYRF